MTGKITNITMKKILPFIFYLFVFFRPFILLEINFHQELAYAVLLLSLLIIGGLIYRPIRINKLDWGVLFFGLLVLISTFIKIINFRSVDVITLYKYLSGIMFYWGLRIFIPKNKQPQLACVLVLSGIVVCMVGLKMFFYVSGQVLKNIEPQSNFVYEYLSRGRAFAPFYLPNLLASYIAMLLFILFAAINDKNYLQMTLNNNFIIVISLGLFFTLLVLTKSLGVGIIIFVVVFLYFIFYKDDSRRNNLLLLLILVIIFQVFLLRNYNVMEYAKPSFSISNRLSYWQQAWQRIISYPFWGEGAGNLIIKGSRYVHNLYLQIWAETGILPFMNFIVLIIMFTSYSYKIIKQNKYSYATGFILVGLFFLLHNMIDIDYFSPQLSYLWWISLAVVNNEVEDVSIDK